MATAVNPAMIVNPPWYRNGLYWPWVTITQAIRARLKSPEQSSSTAASPPTRRSFGVSDKASSAPTSKALAWVSVP